MKNNFTLEVLLLTNTGLSKKEYIERNDVAAKNQPQQNKLAEACWNGMVPVMLPELFEGLDYNNCMMWQLEEGNNSMYMQIGQQPVTPEPEYGLHPWVLLQFAQQN